MPRWSWLIIALVWVLSACQPSQQTWAAHEQAGSIRAPSAQWRKPDEAQLRQALSPLAFEVTQRDATEPAFNNPYYRHKGEGIYVDVVSGEALFASVHKYDSGTGWPSFTRPLREEAVVTKSDRSHGMVRTEVRSKLADSHLGHVFDDGPAPSGLRFCINSAALRFVPKAELASRGYGEWLPLFGEPQPAIVPTTPTQCVEGPMGCSSNLKVAILAGGCFWGMEDILRKVPGVLDTEVGYTGGTISNPTYEQVSSGRSGHAEAIRIIFDPKVLSYEDLLKDWFFRMHDPTTLNQQGNDKGTQYRSAIFALDAEQEAVARQVIKAVDASKQWSKPLVTTVVAAGEFTPAEAYHQDYLVKHPGGYTCHYLRD